MLTARKVVLSAKKMMMMMTGRNAEVHLGDTCTYVPLHNDF